MVVKGPRLSREREMEAPVLLRELLAVAGVSGRALLGSLWEVCVLKATFGAGRETPF